jgi:hypothetical protein
MIANRIVRAVRRATYWSRRTKGEAQTRALNPIAPPTPLPRHLHTLLEWRLTGLGVNPKSIERHSPDMLVDLRSRCALCTDKRRCLEAMMDFRTPPGWEGYCPNAGAIRALLAGAGACRARIAPVPDRRQPRN